MAKLSNMSGTTVKKVFIALGWAHVKTTGSHHQLTREGHSRLSIPIHGNKEIQQGTLGGLIKRAGITKDEFIAALSDL